MKLFAKVIDLYQKVSPSKQNAFHYFVITLPILFSFQNCGSQKFNSQMVDLSSNSSNILGVVPPLCSPTQSRVCKENNGVGFQFCETDGTPRACQIESCESGFSFKNGKCEPQSCQPTTTASCEGLNGSGVRTCNSDGLGFGVCVLNKCSVGYELDLVTKICKPLACVPNTSLGCNIANGVGLQTCKSDGSGYLGCKLQSCDTGYKPSGDFCVASCTAGEKQSCNEANGRGERSCLSSGSGYGACQLNACNDGYNLQNGVCIANLCSPNTSSDCTAGNGSGKQQCNAQGTGYGACLLNACQTGYALVNGSCVPKICEANKASACSVENGAGEKMCNANGTGYGACEVKSCPKNHKLVSGICHNRVKEASIINGGAGCAVFDNELRCWGQYWENLNYGPGTFLFPYIVKEKNIYDQVVLDPKIAILNNVISANAQLWGQAFVLTTNKIYGAIWNPNRLLPDSVVNSTYSDGKVKVSGNDMMLFANQTFMSGGGIHITNVPYNVLDFDAVTQLNRALIVIDGTNNLYAYISTSFSNYLTFDHRKYWPPRGYQFNDPFRVFSFDSPLVKVGISNDYYRGEETGSYNKDRYVDFACVLDAKEILYCNLDPKNYEKDSGQYRSGNFNFKQIETEVKDFAMDKTHNIVCLIKGSLGQLICYSPITKSLDRIKMTGVKRVLGVNRYSVLVQTFDGSILVNGYGQQEILFE